MVEETNGAKKKIGCGGSPAILVLPSSRMPRPAAGRTLHDVSVKRHAVGAQNLADHGRLELAGRREHQHVARLGEIERVKDRSEVGRLAEGSDGAAEQAGLPAGRSGRIA